MSHRPSLHRFVLLPVLVVALALGLAACGDDDDTAANSDGGVPTAPTQGGADDADDDDDPWASMVRGGLDQFNVAEFRDEGDTIVFVMGEEATEEDVAALCDAMADHEKQAATEVDDTVTPCP